ncbi:MAG TPA: hypothetical protein VLW83_08520 [Candidatus Acidoferrales bacterium]|nr:hypothetical protein [Candidatus Acidoferrales bacterium]
MKEPIHDQKQDENCQQPGRGLNGEGGNILAEVVEDAQSDIPGKKSCEESNPRTRSDRVSELLLRSPHARGNRGKDQDTLQTFAKDEHADV